MCHTNVAITSTISVYVVQFPQSIATYLIMIPNPDRGPTQAQTSTQNVKQKIQTMKAFKGDLDLM